MSIQKFWTIALIAFSEMWLRVLLFISLQLYILGPIFGCRCVPYIHSQDAFCDPSVDVGKIIS